MAAEIKVEKDIEEVRALIKEIGTIDDNVNKLQAEWNKYKTTVADKTYGSDKIGNILKELFEKKYRHYSNPANVIIASEYINKDQQTDNSLKTGIYSSYSKNPSQTGVDPQFADTNLQSIFAKNYHLLIEEISKDEVYNDVIGNKDFVNTGIDNTTNYLSLIRFLNDVKKKYTEQSSLTYYSEEEKTRLRPYFSASNNTQLKNTLSELQKAIVDKTTECISKLTDIASRYSGLDTRIKKDVLEKLKPSNISLESDIKIIGYVNTIVLKFLEDYEVKAVNFPAQGGGRKKKTIGGAGNPPAGTTSPKKDPPKLRDEIDNIFKNDIFKNITAFKNIAQELYKGLTRFSNPEMGDTSKGEDSIFNKLFEKYMRTRDDTTKGGPFVASTELINDLKSNDLYPEEVINIDMRDKFVFVATTLFMRIISLIIIDLIIDRKIITRMDTAIFWYGITMTLFIIVFVLIVNFDSYKLRIIFNYVNFHIGYSTTFSYIAQLWLFGGMVYYIMININDDVISSASNDEERARLKHKVQVISMITWFFLTLVVLVM